MDVGFVSGWLVVVAGLACALVVGALVVAAILLLTGRRDQRDDRRE